MNEWFNKSIFRQFDNVDGAQSPPTVSRANPIGMDEDDESCSREDDMYISPYPYSPCQEELDDRQSLVSDFSIPQLANLTEEGETVDYSLYFSSPSLVPRRWDDGIIESYSTQTEACGVQDSRMSSPVQVSDTDSLGDSDY